MVFLLILAVVRMRIWVTRKKGLYDCANFSHCDLIFFFSLGSKVDVIENAWTVCDWVKIRCDRKRLDRITFDRR